MSFDSGERGNKDESIYPQLYQAQHRGYTEDIPLWLDLARSQGDPILELGCGTGRVMISLAEVGYTCYGIDHDFAMLTQLGVNCPRNLAPRIHPVLAEITNFRLEIEFPLIILPCNTYSTLRARERRSSLDCVHQHLAMGGVFATSIPNPEILSDLETKDEAEIDSFFPHPKTGSPVQVSYRLERKLDEVIFHWHYDHLLPDGQVERLSTFIHHTLTSSGQYLEEFSKASYKISEIYGDFNKSPYGQISPYMIIIAQKF